MCTTTILPLDQNSAYFLLPQNYMLRKKVVVVKLAALSSEFPKRSKAYSCLRVNKKLWQKIISLRVYVCGPEVLF